jgi:hypothetical protein
MSAELESLQERAFARPDGRPHAVVTQGDRYPAARSALAAERMPPSM